MTEETGNINGYDLLNDPTLHNRDLPAITTHKQLTVLHGLILGTVGVGKTTFFANLLAQGIRCGLKVAGVEPVRPQLHKSNPELTRFVTNPAAFDDPRRN